jgi:hypothetical protein
MPGLHITALAAQDVAHGARAAAAVLGGGGGSAWRAERAAALGFFFVLYSIYKDGWWRDPTLEIDF